jgi:hypothetical protein
VVFFVKDVEGYSSVTSRKRPVSSVWAKRRRARVLLARTLNHDIGSLDEYCSARCPIRVVTGDNNNTLGALDAKKSRDMTLTLSILNKKRRCNIVVFHNLLNQRFNQVFKQQGFFHSFDRCAIDVQS